MRVSVIGTGYVGLVSGACLAHKGHQVVCVDIDQEKVAKINAGVPPIYEVGLEELLKANIGTRLSATTDLHQAVLSSDISLIAVGTPFDGRVIDLTYVRQAAREIGQAIKDKPAYHVVVVKSTVVPGTTDEVVLKMVEEASGKKAGRDFGVGMNPEFLTEGVAIKDFMQPDRIVVGGIDQRSQEVIEQLYDGFEGVPKLRTNNKTAEMIKYASNSILATMISFSNEIAGLCSALGDTDVADVMNGVHLAHYFTTKTPDGKRVVAPITSFLWAGCGFGGSCLPKDVKALVAHGENRGQPMPLLDTVIKINLQQPAKIVARLRKHLESLKGRKIAILGLAFKPDTDDVRESPALPIIELLLAEGATIRAYDPIATQEASHALARKGIRDAVTFCDSTAGAIDNVDAAILVTRWAEFQKLPELLAKFERPPLLIDGRRMLDKKSVQRYDGVGL